MFSRRNIIKTLLLTLGFLTALPRRVLARKVAVSLEKIKALQKPGGAAIVKLKEQEILFIRVNADSIRAFDPTCSHKQCTVEFNTEEQKIVCPCHGSKYDLEGKVLNGPAEKPLRAFESTLDGNRIIVTVEEEN